MDARTRAFEQRLRDVEAERAVLGACLLDPTIVPALAVDLTEEDFSSPAHAAIWAAVLAVASRGTGVSLSVVTLADELRRADRLNAAGGAQYLGELTDDIPSTAFATAHAKILRDHTLRRRALHEAVEFIRDLPATDPEKHLDAHAGRVIDLMAARAKAGARPQTMGEALDDLLAMRPSTDDAAFVRAPLASMEDKLRWGFGKVAIIAGRPSRGKSVLALQAAVAGAAAGHPALFVTAEMTVREQVQRAMAGASSVPLSRIEDISEGRAIASDDEMLRIAQAHDTLHGLPLEYAYQPSPSLLSVRAEARRMTAKYGRLGMVVIDYLQLMEMPPARRDSTETQDIALVTRGLKRLAGEFNCAVLLLSQLNRATDGRRPKLSDLKGSGAIEADADIVVCLYYPNDVEAKQESFLSSPNWDGELVVLKQRGGATGICRMVFERPCQRFVDPPRTPAVDGDVPHGDDQGEPW